MVGASNAIIKSLPKPEDEPHHALNLTGQVAVAGLVPMSELIAKHIKSIPSTIYSLFQSVLKLRSAHYAQFRQLASLNPDAEVEKSNASHKHFIDTLTRAFEVLGGDSWLSQQKSGGKQVDESADEDITEVILNNKFSALGLGDNELKDEEKASSDEDSGPDTSAPQQNRQKRAARKGKGKKGKQGKKSKTKRKPVSASAKSSTIEEVPLESYRIIEDETGIMTDYLMAVYTLASEWCRLRASLQETWRQVAYEGLNSAVAATVSEIAVAMIKRSESAMFVEFPGHDSYETVMQTITRGDPDKIQGNFKISLLALSPDSQTTKVQETDLDVKEHVMINTYQNLVDFILDFQKNRSGKPTKAMMAETNNWDPNFNLQGASHEEMLKWRRKYTINWLYDLVNVFSSIVVQRNTMKGENHAYENVDWSPQGPWHMHRRLFGLNEFAGAVTSLAMQKQGTGIRKRIQPHIVFQLQCIIDALMVSRGWSLNPLKGHVTSKPAEDFRPRRDVDLFLDRNNERIAHGFLQGVDVLKQILQQTETRLGEVERFSAIAGVLNNAKEDFVDWLGESKYMHGLTTIPPTRFANSNKNGLWEFSPYLCGAGLMEGLELAYRFGMVLWDQMHEPMLIMHLHNMLVQKGYLKRPVGLYASLDILFPGVFFGGPVPESNFEQALISVVGKSQTRQAKSRRQATRNASVGTADIHGILDLDAHQLFRQKSNLILYREADWDPDRIPESDIDITSVLAAIRVLQTKYTVDPKTGNRVLENTDLVKRSRMQGQTDEEILRVAGLFGGLLGQQNNTLDPEVMADLAKGYTYDNMAERVQKAQKTRNPHSNRRHDAELSSNRLLDILKVDIDVDVCGPLPRSSLNYIWVTNQILMLFMGIEDELKKRKNPTYELVYGPHSDFPYGKRLGLALQVLAGRDDECLEVMAMKFEELRGGVMSHIYWKDLDLESGDMMRRLAMSETNMPCCVM